MNFAPLETIANAVLFEGYMLYPYRPSSMKNRQRWNFGTLYPRAFADAQRPPERWSFAAQILVEATETTRLAACVRFLQLVSPAKEDGESWEEGFARSRAFDGMTMSELLNGIEYVFDLSRLSSEDAPNAPEAFRERSRFGRLALSAEKLRDGLYRLHASFSNYSSVTQTSPPTQTNALHRAMQDAAFTSAHLLLGLENGAFVSLLEPPAELEAEAKACAQDGVFPVLAGEPGDRSRVLCSPIILYDYPQVAPESAGDFFDATEMDEMLALRVMTLTDEEKSEMRRGDPHARALLERTETLPTEQLLKVHGAVRGLRRVTESAPEEMRDASIDPFDPFTEHPPLESVQVFGVEVRKGDRVRLWPQKKADILDMAMEGKVAVIEAIEQELEGKVHFAVVLEDDPGMDMGLLRQAGHRFFYSPEEIEPLRLEVP
ncbi:MAG: hypothetical protein WBD10_09870 [Acidobacteriaceae bacterium]